MSMRAVTLMGALQRAHQYHRGGGARAQAVGDQGDRNLNLVQQNQDLVQQLADRDQQIANLRQALDQANFAEREAIAKEGETFAAFEEQRDRATRLADLLTRLETPPEKIAALTAQLAAEREAHAMTGVALYSAKETIIDLVAKESERASDTPLTPPAKVLRLLTRHGILTRDLEQQRCQVLGIAIGGAAPSGSSPSGPIGPTGG